MKYATLLFFYIIPFIVNSQSLGLERVAKIKSSTVRIIVEGGISIGTGFFVNGNGLIVTCYHVVSPALQNNKKTFIEFNNGDTMEVGIPDILRNDTSFVVKGFGYDFCLLSPIRPIKTPFSFLNIGDYNNANEGEEIITCGYPLGSKIQFISKGIISTKYENNFSVSLAGINYNIQRKDALLDITLNRGNSGGAIVKLGITPEQDSVIGIADFGVNPLGNRAESIIKELYPNIGTIAFNVIQDSSGKVISAGNDPNRLGIIFAEALGNTSIGVSGCVSVNHLIDFLKGLKK